MFQRTGEAALLQQRRWFVARPWVGLRGRGVLWSWAGASGWRVRWRPSRFARASVCSHRSWRHRLSSRRLCVPRVPSCSLLGLRARIGCARIGSRSIGCASSMVARGPACTQQLCAHRLSSRRLCVPRVRVGPRRRIGCGSISSRRVGCARLGSRRVSCACLVFACGPAPSHRLCAQRLSLHRPCARRLSLRRLCVHRDRVWTCVLASVVVASALVASAVRPRYLRVCLRAHIGRSGIGSRRIGRACLVFARAFACLHWLCAYQLWSLPLCVPAAGKMHTGAAEVGGRGEYPCNCDAV